MLSLPKQVADAVGGWRVGVAGQLVALCRECAHPECGHREYEADACCPPQAPSLVQLVHGAVNFEWKGRRSDYVAVGRLHRCWPICLLLAKRRRLPEFLDFSKQ